jgi:serine/threonine protein kinase
MENPPSSAKSSSGCSPKASLPVMSGDLSNLNSALSNSHSVSRSQVQMAGKYQILNDLGEGTFGSVKLGKHSTKGSYVAIKILEKSRIKEQADIDRVVREIKILKEIDHPNFVKLYEIIENQERIYLIMEYASGGELFDYIVSKDRLTEKVACMFYSQILDGIEYLH